MIENFYVYIHIFLQKCCFHFDEYIFDNKSIAYKQ